MVRARVKQPTEKKETSKKKVQSKIKRQETGVWPCKIDGCNKEFAREADLRRHQRTTKVHMLPTQRPVTCPQCDATFTRTDALRRHQKSRHNGIIVSPVYIAEIKQDTEGEGSNASASNSRVGTPSKGKSKATSVPGNTASAPVYTLVARPETSAPLSGSQSYYRQHTINPVFVPPRTPNGILDTSKQLSTQPPISAARLHGANWVPPPPWIHESPTTSRHLPGTMAYVPPLPGYYAPGAYYRTANGQPAITVPAPLPPGTVTMHVNPTPAAPLVALPLANNENDESNATTLDGNIDPSLGTTSESKERDKSSDTAIVSEANSFADPAGINAAVQKALQVVLAIDPSLNAAVASATAALQAQAALGKQNRVSDNPGEAQDQPDVSLAEATDMSSDIHEKKNSNKEADIDAEEEAHLGDGAVDESQPENFLAEEDGAPMLRPDELLNEESFSYSSSPS